jgi:hypothetical protein
MMISPHPDTAQKIAEGARRERLARLAEPHRYPGPPSVIWARFRTGPVARWLEFRTLQRRQATSRSGRPGVRSRDIRVRAESVDSGATNPL